MFVTTAIAPATSLVSAQIRPIIVPTSSTATIAASQYKIRRLVMSPSLLSWGHFANRTAHRFTGHRGSSELIDPGHRFSPLLLQLVAGDDEREIGSCRSLPRHHEVRCRDRKETVLVGQKEWDWDRYAAELNLPEDRLAIGRDLVNLLMEARAVVA